MINTFFLPVNADERVRVIYQKPEGYDAAPAKKAVPKNKKFGKKLIKDVMDLGTEITRKPLIIMLHGFPGGHKGGCGDLFGEMEYRFEGLGYPSVRFDFRGCGESDGLEENFCLETALEDLNAVCQWAQHEAGHRSLVFMGESCGATIAVLGFQPKTVVGMILLWPALKLKETSFKDLFTLESRVESMTKDMPYVTFNGHKIGSHFLNDIYTADLTIALENINVPTLLQHGTADSEVPLDQAYYARDCLPGLIDLGIFEGGEHGLKAGNMRQYMFMNIRHYLERMLKKLDSPSKN